MKKNKIIILGLLIISIIGLSIFFFVKKEKKAEINLKEISPVISSIDVSILSTGIVQPENRLDIKPPVAGRVETLLKQEGDIVKKGDILGTISSTERAALIDAARSKGEEEVKYWQELYKPTTLIAPINGMMISRKVEPGQTVTANDAVYTMSDRLTIKAQVDETDIASIKPNQEARLVLDAYPNEKFIGKVVQIAYDSKTVNNITTYIVDVLPNKAPAFMRSGMTANVTFMINSKSDILTISNEAIKVKNGKFIVQIKSPSHKTEDREIETGITDGKITEIISGISPADKVLIQEYKAPKDKEKQSNPFAPPAPPSNKRGNKGGK